MTDKTVHEKQDRHPRLKKCEALKATKINAGIYRKLKDITKKRDVRFYHLQQVIIAAFATMAGMTDVISKSKCLNASQADNVRRMALDALSLTAHTNFGLNV